MTNEPFKADADQDVFGEVTTFQIDPEKDYFAEFVGDGKKYRDPQAAGRALAEKDAFISKLQKETKEMREEIQKQKTMEELIDHLTPKHGLTNNRQDNPVRDEDHAAKALTPEELSQLVQSELDKRQSKSQLDQNYHTVVATLKEKFGDNANRVIADKAQELGVDINFLKQLATEKPKVFLAMVGQAKPREEDFFSGPVRSTVDPTRLTANKSSGERNKSFYDKLRVQDKNKYWSRDVQAQMHKDAMSLGEKFFT
jgi:hypothetical protein